MESINSNPSGFDLNSILNGEQNPNKAANNPLSEGITFEQSETELPPEEENIRLRKIIYFMKKELSTKTAELDRLLYEFSKKEKQLSERGTLLDSKEAELTDYAQKLRELSVTIANQQKPSRVINEQAVKEAIEAYQHALQEKEDEIAKLMESINSLEESVLKNKAALQNLEKQNKILSDNLETVNKKAASPDIKIVETVYRHALEGAKEIAFEARDSIYELTNNVYDELSNEISEISNLHTRISDFKSEVSDYISRGKTLFDNLEEMTQSLTTAEIVTDEFANSVKESKEKILEDIDSTVNSFDVELKNSVSDEIKILEILKSLKITAKTFNDTVVSPADQADNDAFIRDLIIKQLKSETAAPEIEVSLETVAAAQTVENEAQDAEEIKIKTEEPIPAQIPAEQNVNDTDSFISKLAELTNEVPEPEINITETASVEFLAQADTIIPYDISEAIQSEPETETPVSESETIEDLPAEETSPIIEDIISEDSAVQIAQTDSQIIDENQKELDSDFSDVSNLLSFNFGTANAVAAANTETAEETITAVTEPTPAVVDFESIEKALGEAPTFDIKTKLIEDDDASAEDNYFIDGLENVISSTFSSADNFNTDDDPRDEVKNEENSDAPRKGITLINSLADDEDDEQTQIKSAIKHNIESILQSEGVMNNPEEEKAKPEIVERPAGEKRPRLNISDVLKKYGAQ